MINRTESKNKENKDTSKNRGRKGSNSRDQNPEKWGSGVSGKWQKSLNIHKVKETDFLSQKAGKYPAQKTHNPQNWSSGVRGKWQTPLKIHKV